MNFDQLVDRLTSLFDVSQARAVDVANERLARMVSEAQSLRASISVGTTTAGLARYSLPSNVVHVYKLMLAEPGSFPDDNLLPADDEVPGSDSQVYEGQVSIEDMWDIQTGRATLSDGAYVFAIEPNADEDMNTEAIRLRPAPSTTGQGIIALVALRPNTVTYGSGTALPIPIDVHNNLLDGAKAELLDEDDRQDLAAKLEGSFAEGTRALAQGVTKRGKGSGRHRLRMAGYDFAR
jgi:hypothetical protein